MTLSIISDAATAGAGDNFLFSERVPSSEHWELLAVSAMNATTVCVVRLEILSPAGTVQVIKQHHQGRITNFDHLNWVGQFPLPAGWQVRVLLTYCQSGDALAGNMIVRRRLIGR